MLWGIYVPKHQCFLCLPTSGCSECDFYPTFNSPLYMTVCCKFSKTYPFGRGHTLYLFSTHTLTCPVAAMKKCLSLKKYDPHAPLLCLGDGTPLTCSKFVKMLRSVLQKLGFQPTIYTGTGLPDYLIKALGRWSSECYIQYIHTPRKSLQAATLSMAQASSVW